MATGSMIMVESIYHIAEDTQNIIVNDEDR